MDMQLNEVLLQCDDFRSQKVMVCTYLILCYWQIFGYFFTTPAKGSIYSTSDVLSTRVAK